MKIWEMIRDGMIGDQFECTSELSNWDGAIYEISPTATGSCVLRKNGGMTGYVLDLCSAALNAEWTKLVKPVVKVDFFEAYKAFMEGKTIKSDHKGETYNIGYANGYATAFSTDVINSKWIVLEDEFLHYTF